MNCLLNPRGVLRPAIFSACALAAFASPLPKSFALQPQTGDETWLTRDEFRAPDGSLLQLFENHYTDVSMSTAAADPGDSGPASQELSDYVDLGGSEFSPHADD